MNRREVIQSLGMGASLLLAQPLFSISSKETMNRRSIPSTGELLPMVGVGTWQTFDVSNSQYGALREVLKILRESGGSVIDSSPMYGRSESVVGKLTLESSRANSYFYATKVWTSGRESGKQQMKQSTELLKRRKMDLMQIHNLVDWQTHLETLRNMKAEGKIKYMGLTHYTNASHSRLEEIIRKEKDIDFLQFNYSIGVRHAEKRLLKAAKDEGVAVIINRPYEGGSVFSMVRGKDLPEWAADYDIKSWGQFFLKYILSHPSVNCVIPGTDKPHHMLDNVAAGFGRLPDDTGRRKMTNYFDAL